MYSLKTSLGLVYSFYTTYCRIISFSGLVTQNFRKFTYATNLSCQHIKTIRLTSRVQIYNIFEIILKTDVLRNQKHYFIQLQKVRQAHFQPLTTTSPTSPTGSTWVQPGQLVKYYPTTLVKPLQYLHATHIEPIQTQLMVI